MIMGAEARRPPPVAGHGAVLLCSDVVGHEPASLSAETICDRLRQRAPEVRVYVVPDLCSRLSGLPATVRALSVGRVVVGCRRGNARRQRIMGFLRDAGLTPAGAQVVDLLPGALAAPGDVAEQSVARLRAALARVSGADLGAPVRETAAGLGPGRVSRRDLFGLGHLGRRPVAAWAADRCQGREASRLCAQACPAHALSAAGPGLSVDATSCSGCGACVAACRSGAMSLSGATMGELEAAAAALVEDAGRLGLGVAIVCSSAPAKVTLGGRWLALEVPSLEMVTAGWLLQVVAAGAAVTVRGCGERACHRRGLELARLSGEVVSRVAPGRRGLVVVPGVGPGEKDSAARLPDRTVEVGRWARPDGPIELHEPEATVHALCALFGSPAPWQLTSPVAPLGDVVIDTARCSACGVCVTACPTGAMSAPPGQSPGSLVLDFEASACPACGACASACPEGALSVQRAIGSSCLRGGRRTVARLARAVPGNRCLSCGAPSGAGLVTQAVAAKLAGSHPAIAWHLLAGEDRCPSCRLRAP